ncbi:MAG TPA: TMEM175 family protein [Thermoplasmata archaeon]|nr:TMEM175 family protein [Thermoplasmata archaeon]
MAGDEDPSFSEEEEWRRQHGYRLAGQDFGRILALSDGVFAFAMTLLVISLIVPTTIGSPPVPITTSHQLSLALLRDWGSIVGFVFAFVMIGVWWIVHNRTFQYIARYDSPLVWINMMILIQVSLMPFVMGVYNAYSGYQAAIVLFAGIQVTLGLTNALLWEYAHRRGLLKKGIPEAVTDYYTKRGLLVSVVFAISIGVSFYSAALAELCWIGIFLSMRFSTHPPEKSLPNHPPADAPPGR